MKNRPLAIALSAALAAGSLAATSGCYGRFAITKKLHTWNGKATKNKFANSFIFWGLVIIPVYGFCAFGDAVVFNVIEFWTGKNPMAQGPGAPAEERYAATPLPDGSVELRHEGHLYHLTPLGDDRVAVRVDGREAGEVRGLPDGGLLLADTRGDAVQLGPDELARLRERLAR